MELWDRVKGMGISAFTKDGFFSIPDGHEFLAADRAHRMLLWIEEEFREDCAAHPDAMLGKNYDPDFLVRNTSRTLSYVNQAYLLEGILMRSYGNVTDHLKVLDSRVEPDKVALKTRATEFAGIKKFRDKVAAHTAFSSPHSDDNTAQELKSLLDLITSSYDADQGSSSFRLGAASMVLGGEEAKYRPEVSIKEEHPRLLTHFEKWIDMFEARIAQVRPLLPKEIDGITYKV